MIWLLYVLLYLAGVATYSTISAALKVRRGEAQWRWSR